jgi:hypothetical protein
MIMAWMGVLVLTALAVSATQSDGDAHLGRRPNGHSHLPQRRDGDAHGQPRHNLLRRLGRG